MLFLVRMYVAIGLRTNMFKVLMVVSALLVFCAWLASGMSGRQPTVLMLDFGLSVLRLTLCLMALLWLQELLGKAIEKRYISQVLAYPLAKYHVLLANFFAVAMLLLLSLVSVAVLLWLAALFGGNQEYTQPALGSEYVLTWAFIYLDLLVVLAFGVLMTAISTTPQMPLVFGLGFYVITHAMGPVIDYLLLADDAEALYKQTISPALSNIRYVIPELSRLDIRQFTLYSQPLELMYVLKQAAFGISYAVVLLCIAMARFSRREFQ